MNRNNNSNTQITEIIMKREIEKDDENKVEYQSKNLINLQGSAQRSYILNRCQVNT